MIRRKQLDTIAAAPKPGRNLIIVDTKKRFDEIAAAFSLSRDDWETVIYGDLVLGKNPDRVVIVSPAHGFTQSTVDWLADMVAPIAEKATVKVII